jgi:hypothetical protein
VGVAVSVGVAGGCSAFLLSTTGGCSAGIASFAPPVGLWSVTFTLIGSLSMDDTAVWKPPDMIFRVGIVLIGLLVLIVLLVLLVLIVLLVFILLVFLDMMAYGKQKMNVSLVDIYSL